MTTGGKPLKGLVLRAAGWSMGGHLTGYVLRIASSLVMTRLLVPEMFGVMAVASVVHVIAALLSDVGLRQAIIHSPRGDSPALLNTAWTLQIIRGLIIWLGCVAVALALHFAGKFGGISAGSVYRSPDLPMVLALSSLSSVIAGFQSTKAITRDRNLDLRQIIYIELVSQIAGLVVMVILALITRSIWSFVAGALASSTVSMALSHIWLPGPTNRLLLDKEAVRELIIFGRWVLISSTLSVMASNGDRLLLGAWISPATLGIYVLAFNLVAMVEGAGGRLFFSVATSALSKVVRDQPERLRSAYYKLRLPFDVMFIGSAGVLYAAGQTIIDILYDARYSSAGHILEVLSFSLLLGRYGVVPALYIAMGVPKYQTVINLVRAVSIFVIVPLAFMRFGFDGALWAIALHTLPTLPVIFWLNRKYGLNHLVFEVLILAVWPIGFVAGLILVYGLQYGLGLP